MKYCAKKQNHNQSEHLWCVVCGAWFWTNDNFLWAIKHNATKTWLFHSCGCLPQRLSFCLKKADCCGMLVGGTWKMAPAKRPDKVLLFFPWGIMDGGLFITHSVTLSNTSKTCSLWWTQIHSWWAGQQLEQISFKQTPETRVMKCNVHGHTRSSGSWFHA